MTRSLRKHLEELLNIRKNVSGSESEENFEEFLGQELVNNNGKDLQDILKLQKELFTQHGIQN